MSPAKKCLKRSKKKDMIKENVIESSPCNVLRGYLDIRCPEEVADEVGLKKDFSLLIALCLPQTHRIPYQWDSRLQKTFLLAG